MSHDFEWVWSPSSIQSVYLLCFACFLFELWNYVNVIEYGQIFQFNLFYFVQFWCFQKQKAGYHLNSKSHICIWVFWGMIFPIWGTIWTYVQNIWLFHDTWKVYKYNIALQSFTRQSDTPYPLKLSFTHSSVAIGNSVYMSIFQSRSAFGIAESWYKPSEILDIRWKNTTNNYTNNKMEQLEAKICSILWSNPQITVCNTLFQMIYGSLLLISGIPKALRLWNIEINSDRLYNYHSML